MSTVVCWFQRTLKQLEREQTDTQTHTQTHRTTTVTLAHARRGLNTALLHNSYSAMTVKCSCYCYLHVHVCGLKSSITDMCYLHVHVCGLKSSLTACEKPLNCEIGRTSICLRFSVLLQSRPTIHCVRPSIFLSTIGISLNHNSFV